MSEPIFKWDSDRMLASFINAVRLVTGGAAGGVAYKIVSTESPLYIDMPLFLVLVAMTGVIEYAILGAEPDGTEEQIESTVEELRNELLHDGKND